MSICSLAVEIDALRITSPIIILDEVLHALIGTKEIIERIGGTSPSWPLY
jgi:hypothetical protein